MKIFKRTPVLKFKLKNENQQILSFNIIFITTYEYLTQELNSSFLKIKNKNEN
jgi:hypothetical protein